MALLILTVEFAFKSSDEIIHMLCYLFFFLSDYERTIRRWRTRKRYFTWEAWIPGCIGQGLDRVSILTFSFYIPGYLKLYYKVGYLQEKLTDNNIYVDPLSCHCCQLGFCRSIKFCLLTVFTMWNSSEFMVGVLRWLFYDCRQTPILCKSRAVGRTVQVTWGLALLMSVFWKLRGGVNIILSPFKRASKMLSMYFILMVMDSCTMWMMDHGPRTHKPKLVGVVNMIEEVGCKSSGIS